MADKKKQETGEVILHIEAQVLLDKKDPTLCCSSLRGKQIFSCPFLWDLLWVNDKPRCALFDEVLESFATKHVPAEGETFGGIVINGVLFPDMDDHYPRCQQCKEAPGEQMLFSRFHMKAAVCKVVIFVAHDADYFGKKHCGDECRFLSKQGGGCWLFGESLKKTVMPSKPKTQKVKKRFARCSNCLLAEEEYVITKGY